MQSFRIRFKSNWTGSKDKSSEKKSYQVNDIEDVDMDTFRALVMQYSIAEAVPVEEIEAMVKESQKPKATKPRASRKKAATVGKDKMMKGSTTKGE